MMYIFAFARELTLGFSLIKKHLLTQCLGWFPVLCGSVSFTSSFYITCNCERDQERSNHSTTLKKSTSNNFFFGNFIPIFNNIYFIFQIIKQKNVINYRVIEKNPWVSIVSMFDKTL